MEITSAACPDVQLQYWFTYTKKRTCPNKFLHLTSLMKAKTQLFFLAGRLVT